MMHVVVAEREGVFYVSTDAGHRCEIRLEYGSMTALDYQLYETNCVAAKPVSEALGDDICSELMMATGLSSVARYMMCNSIRHGRLDRRITALLRPKVPYFGHDTWQFCAGNLAVLEAAPVDYVVDLEYTSTVDDAGNKGTLIFGAGIAKFTEGRYLASTLGVDRSVPCALAMARAKPHASTTGVYTQLLKASAVATAEEVVAKARQLAANPKARVFCKGRDNDARLLAASKIPRSILYATSSQATPLREIGHLSPKSEVVASAVGWEQWHNPAKECVLFALAAGLCTEPPDEAIVGQADPLVLDPDATGVYA
jgi:hypothetical protein